MMLNCGGYNGAPTRSPVIMWSIWIAARRRYTAILLLGVPWRFPLVAIRTLYPVHIMAALGIGEGGVHLLDIPIAI